MSSLIGYLRILTDYRDTIVVLISWRFIDIDQMLCLGFSSNNSGGSYTGNNFWLYMDNCQSALGPFHYTRLLLFYVFDNFHERKLTTMTTNHTSVAERVSETPLSLICYGATYLCLPFVALSSVSRWLDALARELASQSRVVPWPHGRDCQSRWK